MNKKNADIYMNRLSRLGDELRWLYMEMYDNSSMYAELMDKMYEFYDSRKAALKKSDVHRETHPEWYKNNKQMGMMIYIDNFAGTIKGVIDRLGYLEALGISYLHLMPFLDVTEGKSDGGYAVSDFRKVREDLGTMKDIEALTKACHDKGINVCCDFVLNHTSEDHEWAKRARSCDGEYMSRYFFYDRYDIPYQFEQTVPQVFPTTAPGNFTYLPDIGYHVMTSFYPYQWDLNYRNPRVFNEMLYNLLYLANEGIDIIRLDAVPYIWKQLGTNCRNLPEVHTLVRMMRIITEIVCPGTLLLGEVVMEPQKVVPYFGSVEKPECHMLYNVTTMATTWHTVATRDTRLLKNQQDKIDVLPKEYVFLNYLRCHDDIGWGLDYAFLENFGMKEIPHKKYLNDYFRGYAGGSCSRGELYNDDQASGDARLCGTTASLSGIEKAGFEGDDEAMKKAVDLHVMLHAYMFMQSGIPIIYSGDEVGQVNDYTYKDDPKKSSDSRYLHRGAFRWDNISEITGDAEGKDISKDARIPRTIYKRLRRLIDLRKSCRAYDTAADIWTVDPGANEVLCIGRYYEGQKIYGLFNFSENEKKVTLDPSDGMYKEMITGEESELGEITLPGYGFRLYAIDF